MLTKFNDVLLSEKNQQNLHVSIKQIGQSFNYDFHDDDINSCLENQLKSAIESNISGNKYLINSNILKSTNLHIALKATKELKELYSVKMKNIPSDSTSENFSITTSHESRRQEITVDRFLEPPRRDDVPISIRKMTPRELLKY